MRSLEEISKNVEEAHFIANQIYAAVFPTLAKHEIKGSNAHQRAQNIAHQVVEEVEMFVLKNKIKNLSPEEVYQLEANKREI